MNDQKSSFIEVSLIKPFPDIRSEARIHALSNDRLNLFSNKDDILDIVTNHKFNKNAYYDLYNSITENNEFVIFNFRLVTSKIFREYLKASTDANIEEKSDSESLSEEFTTLSDYTKSCEYFVSINMSDLIKFLLSIRSHEVFSIYYNKIVSEVDKEISYQIHARNVFTDILTKSTVRNFNFERKWIPVSLDEISYFNRSKYIKLVIGSLNITKSSSINGTCQIEVYLRQVKDDGIYKEIVEQVCNSANLNNYQIEFLLSYCESNKISLESLIPCGFNCNNCICKNKQILKILDGQENPCPIFIENKIGKSNSVFDQLTKNLINNDGNPYYQILKKVK